MSNKHTVAALATVSLAFTPDARPAFMSASLLGSIDVVSFGTAEVTADGTEMHVLHARISFTSSDRLPWTFDVAAARVTLRDDLTLASLFASSDAALPLVRIGPREHRVVDLYFGLPSSVTGDAQLDELTLMYRVNTPDHRYEATAVLRRSPLPAMAEPVLRPGQAAYLWAAPDHEWTSYYHRDGRLVPRPPRSIVIRHDAIVQDHRAAARFER